MINKGKMPWSFIKFSQVILKKIYGEQFGEFVCGYWGLIKGLKKKNNHHELNLQEFGVNFESSWNFSWIMLMNAVV